MTKFYKKNTFALLEIIVYFKIFHWFSVCLRVMYLLLCDIFVKYSNISYTWCMCISYIYYIYFYLENNNHEIFDLSSHYELVSFQTISTFLVVLSRSNSVLYSLEGKKGLQLLLCHSCSQSSCSVNGKCVCDVHRTSSYTSELLSCCTRIADYYKHISLPNKQYVKQWYSLIITILLFCLL